MPLAQTILTLTKLMNVSKASKYQLVFWGYYEAILMSRKNRIVMIYYLKKLCIIFLNLAPRHAEDGLVASDTRMS